MKKTVLIPFAIILIVINYSGVLLSQTTSFVGRLDNGMDVVLEENHSVPMIACNIVIRSGSRNENWQTWGAAHFLEHLLFNGTHTRTQEQIYAQFDMLGAYHNAHTGKHYVDFMLLTARDNFLPALDIMTDMVFNSTLPVEKFEKERGIVIEEIAKTESRDNGQETAFLQGLYGNSALSREVLGTTESIARLDRNDVLDFYHSWYVPNNMLLYVTGDFQADTMFQVLQEKMSQFRPRELPEHVQNLLPDFESLSELDIVERGWQEDDLSLMTAWEAPSPGEKDFPLAILVEHFYGKRLQQTSPTNVRTGVYHVASPDMSLFQVSLNGSPDEYSAEDLADYLHLAAKSLIDNPPTESEIISFADAYKADRLFNSERLHYYGIMYSQFWALASWDEFQSWHDRIAETKPEEISTAISKWLNPSNNFKMVFRPIQEKPTDTLHISDSAKKKTTVFTLKNSPTLLVRSDPSSRVFAMHILFKDRWMWDRNYGEGAVDVLHQALVADPERNELKRLDELSARLKCVDSPYIPYDDYYTSPDYSFLRLEVIPENWREAVTLVAEMLAKPHQSDEIIKSARSASMRAGMSSKRSATKIGREKVRNYLKLDDAWTAKVYGDGSSPEVDKFKEIWRYYFDPSNMVISVCGPEQDQEMVEFLNNTFVSRSTMDVTSGYPNGLQVTDQPKIPFEIADEVGLPQGAVVMGQKLNNIPEADIPALYIANAYLNERLSFVLREERGLAYSLGSSVTVRPSEEQESRNYWEIYIGTRAENLDNAKNGIFEVLKEVRKHKFTEAEITKLANATAGRFMMRDMARIGQAFNMGIGQYYWSNPDHYSNLAESISKVTPAQVKSAVKQFLSSDKFVTAVIK